MLISLLNSLTNRSKVVVKTVNIRGYQRSGYLLVFYLHKVNTFYTAY
jgi:hypothetical protein